MFKEAAHGSYALSFSEGVLYCDYSDGFNKAGVKKLVAEMLSMMSHESHWVLYQKPEPSAGITHDAIKDMMAGYVALQNAGCQAVAIVENSVFVTAGIPYHPDELTMPIKIDKDERLLLEWVKEFL